MPNTTVGKLLKQFSMDTGISQKDVAERLQYSPQRVNNYFRDIADPPHDFYEKFRAEFSIDLKRLMEKKDKSTTASVNPIPVFDLELNPSKELDFFNYPELVSYYIDVPMFNDCFAAVKVPTGDAMSPRLTGADVAAIKRITNFDLVVFNEPHIIITEETTFARCIRRNDDDPKKSFLLKAWNPEFDDMNIKKTDIKYLFQVKGKITRF